MREIPEFKTIPKGHTFVAYTQLFLTSISAKRIQNDLFARALHRDPLMYDLDGLTGHDSLGAFALVEEHFEIIMKSVADKKWDFVYAFLDAFLMYNFRSCPKPMGIKDAERKHGLLRLYGACVVRTLVELDKQGRLNTDNFPGLEYFLRYTIEWSQWAKEELMFRCQLSNDILPHVDVCKTIALRLFKNQTVDDRNVHLTRIREWVEWLRPRATEGDLDHAGLKVWVQNWIKDEWPSLLLGANPWYGDSFDGGVHEELPLQDPRLDLETQWSWFSSYTRQNPLIPPNDLSWEFRYWPEEQLEMHRNERVFESPLSLNHVRGDDSDDDSDKESMGWGMERSFWNM